MLIKVMGCELSMMGMGDVTAENTGHIGVALQWGDEIHQPHAICGDGVLGYESDVLTSGQLNGQVAGSSMAEILFLNSVNPQPLVLRKCLQASVAGGTVDQ